MHQLLIGHECFWLLGLQNRLFQL